MGIIAGSNAWNTITTLKRPFGNTVPNVIRQWNGTKIIACFKELHPHLLQNTARKPKDYFLLWITIEIVKVNYYMFLVPEKPPHFLPWSWLLLWVLKSHSLAMFLNPSSSYRFPFTEHTVSSVADVWPELLSTWVFVCKRRNLISLYPNPLSNELLPIQCDFFRGKKTEWKNVHCWFQEN